MTKPRDSHALCLLGLAQLAQYESNPNSDRSKVAIADACLSFQASIELENRSQSGEPPEQLSSEYMYYTVSDVKVFGVTHSWLTENYVQMGQILQYIYMQGFSLMKN